MLVQHELIVINRSNQSINVFIQHQVVSPIPTTVWKMTQGADSEDQHSSEQENQAHTKVCSFL